MAEQREQQGVDAREIYESGRKAMESGRIDEACTHFAESASLEPHFKTLELLGECHLLLGKAREAVVPLAAATALNEQSRAPALLAEAFLAVGDPERAAEFASLAIRRSPENRRALRALAATGRTDTSDDAGPRA